MEKLGMAPMKSAEAANGQDDSIAGGFPVRAEGLCFGPGHEVRFHALNTKALAGVPPGLEEWPRIRGRRRWPVAPAGG